MRFFNIFLILTVIIFSLFVISCDNGQRNETEFDTDNIIIPSKKVTVSFDSDGGNEVESITQTVGKFYELPTPEKKGYTFLGWYHNDTVVATTGEWQLDKDVELVAKWSLTSYLINYITIGGENSNPTTYTVEDELTLAPLKWQTTEANDIIYVFEGWYKDLEYKEPYSEIAKGTTGNLVIYAKWNVIDIPDEKTETQILFDADGYDCDGTTIKLTIGEEYSLPIIQKNGYAFAGWQSENGQILLQNSGIWICQDEKITLVPSFTKITYSISYALNGGTNNDKNVESYTVTDEIMLHAPTKHDHRFEGWFTDEAFENQVDRIYLGTYGDITLYAKWYKISHQITYDFNGGIAGSGEYPEKFDVFTDDLEIGIPYRDGYKFIGWESDDEIIYYYKISAGTDKDIALKAQWYKASYTYQDDIGIQYFLKNDNTLSVVGYVGKVGEIYIPSSYNGYTVTEIGDYAFCGYGDSLNKISSSSFYRCDIPDTVVRIGVGAFAACDDLKVQLSYRSEISVEQWTANLVIEERNEHVLDVIEGSRPAIGWKKYYLPK